MRTGPAGRRRRRAGASGRGRWPGRGRGRAGGGSAVRLARAVPDAVVDRVDPVPAVVLDDGVVGGDEVGEGLVVGGLGGPAVDDVQLPAVGDAHRCREHPVALAGRVGGEGVAEGVDQTAQPLLLRRPVRALPVVLQQIAPGVQDRPGLPQRIDPARCHARGGGDAQLPPDLPAAGSRQRGQISLPVVPPHVETPAGGEREAGTTQLGHRPPGARGEVVGIEHVQAGDALAAAPLKDVPEAGAYRLGVVGGRPGGVAVVAGDDQHEGGQQLAGVRREPGQGLGALVGFRQLEDGRVAPEDRVRVVRLVRLRSVHHGSQEAELVPPGHGVDGAGEPGVHHPQPGPGLERRRGAQRRPCRGVEAFDDPCHAGAPRHVRCPVCGRPGPGGAPGARTGS